MKVKKNIFLVYMYVNEIGGDMLALVIPCLDNGSYFLADLNCRCCNNKFPCRIETQAAKVPDEK